MAYNIICNIRRQTVEFLLKKQQLCIIGDMEFWQQIIVIIYGLLALLAFFTSFRACYRHKKAYEDTPIYGLLFTAFVQADAVIFGLFWAGASLVTLLLQDWLLFLLILSVFWLVRSIGETQYWFLQQFSPRSGNDPQKFPLFFKIFQNDSVWFVNQIYWQCITVITIISTVYLGYQWVTAS